MLSPPIWFSQWEQSLQLLEHPVFHLVRQHAKEPKVARIQIWKIRWMEKASKLRIRDFVSNLTIIITYGIIPVDI
jgi:hypothetical protein